MDHEEIMGVLLEIKRIKTRIRKMIMVSRDAVDILGVLLDKACDLITVQMVNGSEDIEFLEQCMRKLNDSHRFYKIHMSKL